MNIRDNFPIYLNGYENLNMDVNVRKIQSIMNYYIQLFHKTDEYKCYRDSIEYLTMVTQLIYLYNDLSIFDSIFYSYEGKGIYSEIVHNMVSKLPFVVTGYKTLNSNTIDNFSHDYPLSDIDLCYQLTYKFDKEEEQLLIDIFDCFAKYHYSVLWNDLNSSSIYTDLVKCSYKYKMTSKNCDIYKCGNPINVIDNSELKNEIKLLDTSSIIGNFIVNYDFSKIKYRNISVQNDAQKQVSLLCKTIDRMEQ